MEPDLPTAPPAAPAPAEPVSIIRPRAKAPTNGNGNGGNGNGNGNGHGNGGNGAHHRKLMLSMPAISDHDQAIRLMQQVRILLEESLSGEQGDEVIIRLPSTSGMVVLKQRDMVACTPSLLDGLRGVLGEEAVVVES